MEKVIFKPEYKDDIENNIEIWVSLTEIGFSRYRLSSLAKIENIKTHTQMKVKHSINNGNYHTVNLYNDNNKKSVFMRVHRLLAMIFIVNNSPNEKKTVDHIDRNINNNNLHNLRWASSSEQNYNRGKYKTQGHPIIQSDKQGNFIRRWNSMHEIIESDNNYKKTAIQNNILGYSKTSRGYIWTYDI